MVNGFVEIIDFVEELVSMRGGSQSIDAIYFIWTTPFKINLYTMFLLMVRTAKTDAS